MGIKTIIQPDGLMAAFSTVSDVVLVFDMTREEYIEWWGERAKRRAVEDMKLDFVTLDKHGLNQFSQMTLEEALESHTSGQCDDPEWDKAIKDRLKAEKAKK